MFVGLLDFDVFNITRSACQSRVVIVELTLVPEVNISESQYGFRKGRGTGMANALLNDVISYCKFKDSPLFLASLDAEKCFDSVCHVSLFVKLIDVLPQYQWLYLYNWYRNLKGVVKWNGSFSNVFDVTRGTRQGSVLSPYLFNIFLNDLLIQLKESKFGVNIGNRIYNSFSYADDISLFSVSVPGLQHLIDACFRYSVRWRFKFNTSKTKCMVVGKSNFLDTPKWLMNNSELANVSKLEILGNIFNDDGTCTDHVDHRANKCRQSFYSLSPVGILYPGASVNVQSYLYKHICQPSLTYGLECINISDKDLQNLNTVQGKLIKQSLGLSKHSHNTQLLEAMSIKSVTDIVVRNTVGLYHRIFKVASPTRTMNFYLMSLYLLNGTLVPGSLLERIVRYGYSPIELMFTQPNRKCFSGQDGHVDSLRALLLSENFIKPYSEEHLLVHLLTTAL